METEAPEESINAGDGAGEDVGTGVEVVDGYKRDAGC